MAKWRADNPKKAAYTNLRNNAKRRGKEFNISYDEFEKFCYETDYIAGKGKSRTSFSIDRKNETLGYTYDNIRVLQNWENVKKYLDYKWNGVEMEFKTKTYGYTEGSSRDNECPF